MQVLFTPKSGNRKTGKIPVSMTERDSCPTACRLYNVCYARGGNLGITWKRLSTGRLPGISWDTFCSRVADLDPNKVSVWRHNQAGDMPGYANRLDHKAALELVAANRAGRRNRGGFTYTHYSPLPSLLTPPDTAEHNAAVISDMNAGGFTVNLSADSAAHADQLAALNLAPVVTVLPYGATKGFKLPSGRTVVVCPALTRDVHCAGCKLCGNATRKVIVGFPAHGLARRKTSIIAETAPPV